MKDNSNSSTQNSNMKKGEKTQKKLGRRTRNRHGNSFNPRYMKMRLLYSKNLQSWMLENLVKQKIPYISPSSMSSITLVSAWRWEEQVALAAPLTSAQGLYH